MRLMCSSAVQTSYRPVVAVIVICPRLLGETAESVLDVLVHEMLHGLGYGTLSMPAIAAGVQRFADQMGVPFAAAKGARLFPLFTGHCQVC